MREYTREELIDICEDAVVPYTKWNNRDSYAAQMEISTIWAGLVAGLDYRILPDTDDETIWIEFYNIDLEKLDHVYNLNIDDLEDYREAFPDDEMFIGYGIDFYHGNHFSGYMPTRERLEEVNGEDWV